jgi:hypothetical protein
MGWDWVGRRSAPPRIRRGDGVMASAKYRGWRVA